MHSTLCCLTALLLAPAAFPGASADGNWGEAVDEASCESNPHLDDLGSPKSLNDCKAGCELNSQCNFINWAADSDQHCILYAACANLFCRAGPPGGWWTTYQYLGRDSAAFPGCAARPTQPPTPPPAPVPPPAPGPTPAPGPRLPGTWSSAHYETACTAHHLDTSGKTLGECKALCEANATCHFITYSSDFGNACQIFGSLCQRGCEGGPPGSWFTSYEYIRPGGEEVKWCTLPLPPAPTPPPAPGALVLPYVLASGMLLQRGKDFVIWGKAAAGATVSISLDGGAAAEGTAAADGSFAVSHGGQPAGTGHTVDVVSGAHSARLTDVAFGDLYLCSGQSNMEYVTAGTFNHSAEVAASADPALRLFTVMKGGDGSRPQMDARPMAYGWGSAGPKTVQADVTADDVFDTPFSATCYYFGRELRRQIDAPVGLIASSVGGSQIEPWMTQKALDSCGNPRKLQQGGYWNAMLHPFTQMRLSGMLWYQGESNTQANTGGPDLYASCFPAAIVEWRAAFAEPSLPFLFVQLSPSSSGQIDSNGVRHDDYGSDYSTPRLRQAQLQALRLPAVGMVTATDLGDPGCNENQAGCLAVAGDAGLHPGHPRVKVPVGARLARQALRIVYGKKLNTDGPVVGTASAAAGAVEVGFTNAAGLHLRNTTMCGLFAGGHGACCSVSSFEVSADGGATWMRTGLPKVDAGRGTVSLPLAAAQAAPQLVRYAWADTPQCMLYNTDPGLPAGPFNITVAAP